MAVLLPTELHEHIVLFAVSDTPNYAVHTSDNRPEFLFHLPPPNHTALRCSLVCRNWLPVGRSHAFRTIELSSDISSKTFLTLASRPLATFVPFVEDLLLNGQTPDRFINLPQDLTQLIPSLPMFPNLRHLTLVNLLLHEIERETWWHEAVPRLFRPSVIALRISYCAFASPMTFTKSIERCVNLSSLDVFDASATSSSNLEGTMCYLPALKSLYLRPSLRNIECMDVLLREILQSQVIRGHTSLNSLGIMQYSTAWPGWNLPRTLVPFVKEFGEIITSLYVTPVIPRPIG
ncbi:hypothetical protein DL96DRAFT_829776 [Flagelloscypha sp. PMI_526]|nr:hypothetical protein DL96DRAFT_829776 [Flagelloscypha sp. PMI_526]